MDKALVTSSSHSPLTRNRMQQRNLQIAGKSTDPDAMAADIQQLKETVVEGVRRVVVGLDDVSHQLLIALVAGGHVLMEGVPGTAKNDSV